MILYLENPEESTEKLFLTEKRVPSGLTSSVDLPDSSLPSGRGNLSRIKETLASCAVLQAHTVFFHDVDGGRSVCTHKCISLLVFLIP